MTHGARSTRQTSNSWASGTNQNCGNVIGDVPSTRVLRPPGGSSALSLAWDQQAEPQGSITGGRGRAPVPGYQHNQGFGQRPKESSNSFASGSNQNSGNFISDHPSTRVMQAPGGRSNFSLG